MAADAVGGASVHLEDVDLPVMGLTGVRASLFGSSGVCYTAVCRLGEAWWFRRWEPTSTFSDPGV